jgi:hypothetical protein
VSSRALLPLLCSFATRRRCCPCVCICYRVPLCVSIGRGLSLANSVVGSIICGGLSQYSKGLAQDRRLPSKRITSLTTRCAQASCFTRLAHDWRLASRLPKRLEASRFTRLASRHADVPRLKTRSQGSPQDTPT